MELDSDQALGLYKDLVAGTVSYHSDKQVKAAKTASSMKNKALEVQEDIVQDLYGREEESK